jgi:hypothetical protein
MPELSEKQDAVTWADADALLRFLPAFNVPGRDFLVRWAGGERTEDGAITFPYPVYCDDVLAFFRLAGLPPWCDYAYNPRRAAAMLADDALIERATLAEIVTLLTYCVRGERFCDGHWEMLLKAGRVQAILCRLAALRDAGAL